MATWFNKVGFYNNPFSIKPAAFHNELFGYEEMISGVLDKVKNNEIMLIEGSYGLGKTTILKAIVRKFGGKRKIAYYNCSMVEYDLDIDNLLKNRGFFGKIFGLKNKEMILLLDECHELNEDDFNRVAEHYEKGDFRSVVFVTPDGKRINEGEKIKNLMNCNKLKLPSLSDENAIALIRKRIGDVKLLPDEVIKAIWKRSDSNPRKLLKNCEKIMKHAVETGIEEITNDVLNKVI